MLTWHLWSGLVRVLTWHRWRWSGLSGDLAWKVEWSVCSSGMDGAMVGPVHLFLSDRVELCLAGGWVSRLMISQGGGIYLVVR